MAKFKNDKGLTLIELLITIAVLAVVSAIALPVINNVVSSSNSNAAAQTQSDVTDFITKYNAAGEVLLSMDGRTLQGYVDTDGDNTIDSNELIDTLTIDSKFSISAAGTSDSVGGSYTSKGISAATTGLAGSAVAAPSMPTLASVLNGRTFPGGMWLDGAWSTETPSGPYDSLFTWTRNGEAVFAYAGEAGWSWADSETLNADGTKTWVLYGNTITQYKLSPDFTSIVPF